jgi:hypothetical protein
MNVLKYCITGLIIIILYGCSANVARYGYKLNQTEVIPECSTPIKLKAEFDQSEVKKLGSIKVYDANLVSKNCDEESVLTIAKRDACHLGADVINITRENQPDYFWSVCYRIKADFLKFNDPQQAETIESDPQYEWRKVQKRGAISRRKGKQAYGMAVGAGVAGGLGGGAAAGAAVGAASAAGDDAGDSSECVACQTPATE